MHRVHLAKKTDEMMIIFRVPKLKLANPQTWRNQAGFCAKLEALRKACWELHPCVTWLLKNEGLGGTIIPFGYQLKFKRWGKQINSELPGLWQARAFCEVLQLSGWCPASPTGVSDSLPFPSLAWKSPKHVKLGPPSKFRFYKGRKFAQLTNTHPLIMS